MDRVTKLVKNGDSAGKYWWDATSLHQARTAFREELKNAHHNPDACAWKWVEYFGIANIHGATRHAAECFPQLMGWRRRGQPPLIERLSRGARFSGLTLMGFRAILALAEFPEVTLDKICEAENFVAQIARRAAVPERSLAFLRLALGLRTGRARQHEGDYEVARDFWRNTAYHGAAHLACEAGRAGILMEWLVAMGRQDEAIRLFNECEQSEPCIGPCGLAPQTTLSLILAPLLECGLTARAHIALDRLALAAPVSRAWLLPAGCRLAALADLGLFAKAQALYTRALPLAGQADVPAWQRIYFHRGAARFLRSARGVGLVAIPSPEPHEAETATILEAFATRNRQAPQAG